MNETQLSGRNLFLLSLLGTIVLVLLWWFFIFNSTRQAIVTNNTQLTEVRQQRQDAQTARTQIPQLERELAELQTEQTQLVSALPQRAELGRLFGALRQDVRFSRARLDRFQVGGTAQGVVSEGLPGGVTGIPVQMEVSGTFPEVYAVMQSVETMNRFANLGNINLTVNSPESFNPDVQSAMNFMVYTFDPARAEAVPEEERDNTTWTQEIIQ